MAYNDDFIVKNGLVVRATNLANYNSTSTQTGAITTPGGAGIGGNVFVGGQLNVLTSATLAELRVNDVAKVLSSAINTATISPDGNALQVTGGIYAGSINIGGLGFIKGSQILTQADGFKGGVISDPLVINTTTNSTSTTTGALSTPGGIGIGQDLWVGGFISATNAIYSLGYQVPTLLTVQAGTGLAGGGTLSATNATITLSNAGVLSLTGGTGINVSTATGNITITNIGVQQVTAGSDIQLSNNTGSVLISDISTFQSVTTRGNITNQVVNITNATANPGPTYNTTSNAFNVLGGASFGSINVLNTSYQGGAQIVTTSTINQFIGGTIFNPLHVANSTTSVSTQTGALIVDGGVGIGQDVYIGKTLNVAGNATIYGSLNVLGTYTVVTVNSTETFIVSPLIDIGTGKDNTALAINDTFDRGIVIHYNTGSNTTFDNHAFFGRVSASGEFTYLTDVQPGGLTEILTNPLAGGNLGTAKFGVLKLAGGTPATGYGTGDLIVTGGGSFNGSLYSTAIYDYGHRVLNNTSVVGSTGISVGVTTTASGVTVTLTNTGVTSVIPGTGILVNGGVNSSTGVVTIANSGVLSILQAAGQDSDIGLTWSTGNAGNVLITNQATLATVTRRGNTSSSQLILSNALQSITDSATNAIYLSSKGGIYAGSIMLDSTSTINGSAILTTATINSNLGGIIPNPIHITSNVASTSTTTGALIVDGGVGFASNLNVQGPLAVNQNITAGGTLAVSGNASVSGNLYTTGTLFAGTITSPGTNLYLNAGVGGTVYANNVNLEYTLSNNFYVQTTGSDANDGLRPATAFATIAHALSVVSSGGTITIGPGTFIETFPLTVPQGVTVKGSGLRATVIQPTSGTNTLDGFLVNGETTLSDFVVSGYYSPGYGLKFATSAKITTKSPYIERVSFITKGSTTTATDPYGYASGNAGNGAKLDGSVLNATSLEPAMLFNEVTFIVPNATGMYMTNGVRAELLNGFFYFAGKAIDAQVGATGLGGTGRTRLKLSQVAGTFTANDTLYYADPQGAILGSGLITANDGTYVYLSGPAYGFRTATNGTAKVVTPYGSAQTSTSNYKFSTASALFNSATSDYLQILSDSTMQFGAGAFTVECWVYVTAIGATQTVFQKGNPNTPATSFGLRINASGVLVGTDGNATLTGSTSLTTGAWHHVAMVRDTNSNKVTVFLDGNVEASQTGVIYSVNNTDPFDIGADSTNGQWYFTGNIDEFRVSNIVRYSSSFSLASNPFGYDTATVFLMHMNGANGGTQFDTDATETQNIYSLGNNPASAKQVSLADYHQFGAELRCIGSAAVFGNQGVIANGTGTDLKLISFNMSFVGAGGDITDDASLTVQANEVIQTNGGRVYYQTVDQNGDFRVGNSFYVNQASGAVSFGNANLNLTSLASLLISNGTNSTSILPGSVQAGEMLISGNTLGSAAGNININPAGTMTIVQSNLQVNGGFSVQTLAIPGSQDATSTQTGALQVVGGIGVGQSVYVGSTLSSITSVAGNAITAINGGIGAQSLYIAGSGYIGDAKIVTTATIGTVLGGNVPNPLYITTTTNTAGTNTGALTVAGGLGIGKDVYVGGTISQNNGMKVLSSLTLALTGIAGDVAYNGITATITLNNIGVTQIISGSDISVSQNTGTVTISDASTLQSVTDRGATTTVAIEVDSFSLSTTTILGNAISVPNGGIGAKSLYLDTAGWIAGSQILTTANAGSSFGGTFNNPIDITAPDNAINTQSGALQVVGGVGIGKDLYVGGSAYISGDLYVDGSNVVINTTSIQTGDKTITFSTGSANAAVASGSGIQVGYSTSTLWASFLFDGVNNWVSGAGINPSLDSQYSLGSGSLRWNVNAATVNFNTATTTSTQFNTATIAGNALQVPGGIGVAHLYISQDGWIGTARIITTANLGSYTTVFDGGTIHTPLIELDPTQSASTATGALQVVGGAGIGKNLYVGGNSITLGNSYTTGTAFASAVYDNDQRVLSIVNVNAGAGINVSTNQLTGPVATLTITNIGVTAITVGAGLSVNQSTGTVNIVNTGVTSITAGTDTAITANSGDITVWNVSTLDSVTQRGATTTATVVFNNALFTTTSITGNAVQVTGGLGVNNLFVQTSGYINGAQIVTTATLNSFSGGDIGSALRITNATDATSTQTGAFQVVGGAGFGKSVWVGKDLHILGDLYIDGINTIVDSTSIQTGDKTISLSTASLVAGNATGAGIKIGPSTGAYATFLFDGNTSWTSGGNLVPSSSLNYNLGSSSLVWSNVYSANAIISASTQASNTQTGSLQVAGGVGISKQVYVGETVRILGDYSNTTTQTGNSLGVAGGGYFGGTLNVQLGAWVGGSQVVTTNNPFDTVFTSQTQSTNTQSGAFQVVGGVGIGGNLNVSGLVSIANSAESTTTPSSNALVVTGGIYADMINIGTIGTVNDGIIITTATIGNFAFNGGTINKPINITTTTVSLSSITGALTVTGGVGIGGATFAWGTFTSQTTASFRYIQMSTATITGIFSSTSALSNTSTIVGNAIQVAGGIGTNYLNIKTAGWLNGSPILTANTLNSYSGGTINNALIINTATQSLNTTTGALQVVNGGVGIGGNVWAGGSYNFIDPTFTAQGYFGPAIDLSTVQVGAYSNQPVAILVNNAEVARFKTGLTGFGNNDPVFGLDLVSPSAQSGSANTISNMLSLVSTNWQTNFSADVPTFEITQTSKDSGNTFENWISVGEQAAGVAQALVFAGGNYYNNGGTPTVTEWARFTPVGNFVVQNQIQTNTELVSSSNNSTSTIAGNALQVTGGIGAAKLYLSQEGWIAGGKIITTANASSIAFNGGTITTPLYINTTTQSSSNITGALRVQGGAGVALNLNVGGVASMNGGLVSVNNTFTNINTITLGSLSVGGNTTFTTSTAAAGVSAGLAGVVVTGGVGIAKNLIVADTSTVLSSVASTTTIAGNALQVTGGIGGKSIYLTDIGYINGAQIVTSDTINQFSGGTISSQLNLSNLTNAVNTSTGALTVAGGVGVGQDMWVGGSMYLLGNLYVDGTQTIVDSTRIQTGDKVIYLSTSSSNATLANGAGIAIGPVGATYASLQFDGISSWQSAANLVPSTSGGFNLGSSTLPWNTEYIQFSRINGGTQSTTATNGTLIVTGGAGISGNLNVGTSATIASQLFNLVQANVTQNALYVAGGIGAQYLNIANSGYVAGSPIITAANIAGYQFSGGTITGILTSTNTTSAFSNTTGAIQAQGGISTQNNLWVGNAMVVGATTASSISTTSNALQVVGGIGAYSIYLANNGYINGSQIVTAATINNFSGGTINSSLVVNSSTQSISTTTGAFQVTNGGVGIGGNVWAGGYANIGGTANQAVTLGTTATGSLQVLGGASITGGMNIGGTTYFAQKVGIGTTNPGVSPGNATLEVNGDGVFGAGNSSRVQITSGGGSNAIYEVQGSETGYRWQLGSNLVTIGVAGLGFMNQNQTLSGGGVAVGAVSGSSGNLGLYTSNGSALTLRAQIDTSGNMILGFGSPTTPLARLDVRGSFRAQSGNTEHVLLSNGASQYVALDITRTNTGNSSDFRIGVNGSAGNFSPSAVAGDATVSFASNIYFANQNLYEVAKITPTGLIITTATVASSASSGALQVQGGAGVTGNFYVGSASSFTGAVYVASALASTSTKAGNAVVVNGGIGAASLWLDNPGWINGYQIVTTANIGSFTGAFNGGTVTNPIYINNTTNATSTSSGGLYTTGGIGLTRDLWVGGNATVVGATSLQSTLGVSGATTVYSTASSTVGTASNALIVIGGLGVASTIYSSGDHYIAGMRVGLGGGAVASNIAIGAGAITATASGTYNIGIGSNALTSLGTGNYNIGIGLQALQNAGAVVNNVAIGIQAMNGSAPGSSSVAIGYQAAQVAQGNYIVAIGQGALAGSGTSNAGSSNIGIGYQAGNVITSGGRNIILGYQAGLTLAGGSQNVLVGYQAGQSITSGGNNVVIGGNNGSGISSSNNNVIISDGAGNIVFQANSSQAVTVPGVTNFTNATTASSTITGAVIITGDMGVRDIYARNIYANGSLVGSGGSGGGSSTSTPYIVVTSGTVATSTGTGALQVYGGGSLYGNLFVGQKVIVNQAYDMSGSYVQVGGAISASSNVQGGALYAAGGNNLLYYSQDWSVSNSNWTKPNSSAGLNAAVSPSGATDATLLTESGATGNHYFQQTLTGVTGPVTFSIYAKANTRTFIALYVNAGGSQHGVYYNLSTGAYQIGPAPLYNTTGKIESVGYSGWYRCSITIWATPAAAITTFGVYSAQGYDTALSGTNTSYTGTGGAGPYIWGAQGEPGYIAGQYQVTTSVLPTNNNNIFAGGSLYIANTATVGNAQVVTTATLMTNLGLYGSTPNTLIINNGTNSTSTTTGALQIVNGGIGIGGNAYVGGTLYATAKSFLIDHPTKKGYKLQYGSLEGPENGVYVRGKLDGRIIELPDYWNSLVDMNTITVDLTPIGKFQKLYVEKIEGNKIYVDSDSMFSGNVQCFYTVWAERKDIDKLNTEFKG